MIKVGCAGYPVARDRYWRTLSFVEADTAKRMPRPATLEAWRADVPKGGEISVQAARAIAADGAAFRDTLEVHEAWMSTKGAAEILGAKIVVFDTPASFLPGPDRLRDMYRFFKSASRGSLSFVWHPRGAEWSSLADKVCAELGLIRAFDPLRQPAPKKGRFLYMRPGLPRMGSLSVDNLATIKAAADDVPAFLVLSHRNSFRDAERLVGGAR